MRSDHISSLRRQSGISLVGTMIALLIGLFLIGGVSQVYVAHVSTFGFVDAYSRTQENGRFAMDLIAQDLRGLGFWGCASFDPSEAATVVNHLNTSSQGYIEVVHDFLGQGGLGGADNVGVNDSDILVVRGVQRRASNVHPPFNANTAGRIHVSDTDTIETGDIVLISDCQGADIFQVSGVGPGSANGLVALSHLTTGTPGNFNSGGACSGASNAHCLARTYGADAIVSELQTVVYSIAPGANGEPALWRSKNGVNEELVDGVADMQILYGVDTDDDGSVNQYFDSNGVPGMNAVNAVRISLLIESANDGVVDQPQSYRFNGVDVAPTDRRLRQVFSTTIGLRNRGADRI